MKHIREVRTEMKYPVLHNGFNFRPGIIIDSKSQYIEMRFYVLCEEGAQDLAI